MKMEQCYRFIRCDFLGCKNDASYTFKNQTGEACINLCKSCTDGIYSECQKQLIPKAVEAPFKKIKKVRSEK